MNETFIITKLEHELVAKTGTNLHISEKVNPPTALDKSLP